MGATGDPGRPAALLRAALTYRGAARAGAAIAVCVQPCFLAFLLASGWGLGNWHLVSGPRAAYICFSGAPPPGLPGQPERGGGRRGEAGQGTWGRPRAVHTLPAIVSPEVGAVA